MRNEFMAPDFFTFVVKMAGGRRRRIGRMP